MIGKKLNHGQAMYAATLVNLEGLTTLGENPNLALAFS